MTISPLNYFTQGGKTQFFSLKVSENQIDHQVLLNSDEKQKSFIYNTFNGHTDRPLGAGESGLNNIGSNLHIALPKKAFMKNMYEKGMTMSKIRKKRNVNTILSYLLPPYLITSSRNF